MGVDICVNITPSHLNGSRKMFTSLDRLAFIYEVMKTQLANRWREATKVTTLSAM
jgi:hypothetical protein